MKRRKAEQLRMQQQQFMDAVRHASVEQLEAGLKALTNGHGGKRKKRVSRFKGTDHWIPRDSLDAICAVETPFYATLFRLCAFHGLRISEPCHFGPATSKADT